MTVLHILLILDVILIRKFILKIGFIELVKNYELFYCTCIIFNTNYEIHFYNVKLELKTIISKSLLHNICQKLSLYAGSFHASSVQPKHDTHRLYVKILRISSQCRTFKCDTINTIIYI